MSYVDEIKNKIYGDYRPDNTVNAAIYARVSTSHLDQRESCDNQVKYALSYIEQHPNINLQGIYIDDGISGKNDKRPEYQKMLEAVNEGKVQAVIIKDPSRSNRSIANSLELEEILVDNDATFINLASGNIEDLVDPEASLARQFQYLFDQKVVTDQSRKGKITQQRRIREKQLSAKDISYGYFWDKNTKSIVINAEESKVVERIFEDFALHNVVPADIVENLKAEGIVVKHIKRDPDTREKIEYYSPMCRKTITNILRDERYIGNFYINKRTSKLKIGKKQSERMQLPKEQWVLIERPDLRIIPDELFFLAQKIRECRQTPSSGKYMIFNQGRNIGHHLFSHLIKCSECGKYYRYDDHCTTNSTPFYRMSRHTGCLNQNNRITEDDLVKIISLSLKAIYKQEKSIFDSFEAVLLECVKASQDNSSEIKALQKKLDDLKLKEANIIDTISLGIANENAKASLLSKLNQINNLMADCEKELAKKESVRTNEHFLEDKMKEIKKVIHTLSEFKTIDRERILNYIEEIKVFPDGSIHITLKSGVVIPFGPTIQAKQGDEIDSGKSGIQDDRY